MTGWLVCVPHVRLPGVAVAPTREGLRVSQYQRGAASETRCVRVSRFAHAGLVARRQRQGVGPVPPSGPLPLALGIRSDGPQMARDLPPGVRDGLEATVRRDPAPDRGVQGYALC